MLYRTCPLPNYQMFPFIINIFRVKIDLNCNFVGLLHRPLCHQLVLALSGHRSLFNFLNYCDWPRITDEGSVPEMRIWFILWIKSVLKWCIHLSRSIFLYWDRCGIPARNAYHSGHLVPTLFGTCICSNSWRKIEKVPRGIQGEKSSRDMASSRNLVSIIGAQASPKKGDGPGVRKGKHSLLASHTRCKCSMETTHNSVKVKLGIIVMKLVESLIG